MKIERFCAPLMDLNCGRSLGIVVPAQRVRDYGLKRGEILFIDIERTGVNKDKRATRVVRREKDIIRDANKALEEQHEQENQDNASNNYN